MRYYASSSKRQIGPPYVMTRCEVRKPQLVVIGKRESTRDDDYLPGLLHYSVFFRERMYAYQDGWTPVDERKMSLSQFNEEFPLQQEIYEVNVQPVPTKVKIRAFTKEWVRTHLDYQTWGNNSQLYAKHLLHNFFQIKIRTQTHEKLSLFLAITSPIYAMMVFFLVGVIIHQILCYVKMRTNASTS